MQHETLPLKLFANTCIGDILGKITLMFYQTTYICIDTFALITRYVWTYIYVGTKCMHHAQITL